MELSTFSLDCGQESSALSRNKLETQHYDRDNIYDPAQDILDTCNRDLEELRLKVLKTSVMLTAATLSTVRSHMLEVDLATQFNPRNQQLYVDAQEACKHCAEAIDKTHQDVSKLMASEAAPTQEGTRSTDLLLTEEQDSLGVSVERKTGCSPSHLTGDRALDTQGDGAKEGCP